MTKGSNHAQFGDCGIQTGDEKAGISGDEQQLTVEKVLEMIGGRN